MSFSCQLLSFFQPVIVLLSMFMERLLQHLIFVVKPISRSPLSEWRFSMSITSQFSVGIKSVSEPRCADNTYGIILQCRLHRQVF